MFSSSILFICVAVSITQISGIYETPQGLVAIGQQFWSDCEKTDRDDEKPKYEMTHSNSAQKQFSLFAQSIANRLAGMNDRPFDKKGDSVVDVRESLGATFVLVKKQKIDRSHDKLSSAEGIAREILKNKLKPEILRMLPTVAVTKKVVAIGYGIRVEDGLLMNDFVHVIFVLLTTDQFFNTLAILKPQMHLSSIATLYAAEHGQREVEKEPVLLYTNSLSTPRHIVYRLKDDRTQIQEVSGKNSKWMDLEQIDWIKYNRFVETSYGVGIFEKKVKGVQESEQHTKNQYIVIYSHWSTVAKPYTLPVQEEQGLPSNREGQPEGDNNDGNKNKQQAEEDIQMDVVYLDPTVVT